MTSYNVPDEVINFLGERGYGLLRQTLAETRCEICKRLYCEHTEEEFKEHALGGAGIEVNIAPPAGHSLLHFQGHTCADCGRCAECRPLLDEEWRQRYGNESYFVASDECSECGRLFSEHDSQEMKACTDRIIAKRQAHC